MSDVADIFARCKKELMFTDLNNILDDLRAEGIIEHQDYLDIIKKGKKEKFLFLQEHLPEGGNKAFPAFIKILRKRDYGDLATKLEKGKP